MNNLNTLVGFTIQTLSLNCVHDRNSEALFFCQIFPIFIFLEVQSCNNADVWADLLFNLPLNLTSFMVLPKAHYKREIINKHQCEAVFLKEAVQVFPVLKQLKTLSFYYEPNDFSSEKFLHVTELPF